MQGKWYFFGSLVTWALLKLLYSQTSAGSCYNSACLCAQELEVEKFITHSVPFTEINKAFDLMAKGEGIRCIIRMDN